MAYLLDTGILLRFVNTNDRQESIIHAAVGRLVASGEQLFITNQNVAEFCNVVTRPVENNGFGRTPIDALDAVERDIEPICSILVETTAVFSELKRLIATYAVTGKQVHDARLVAMMRVWQIENVLTLNDRDFRRYEQEGIHIATPAALVNPP